MSDNASGPIVYFTSEYPRATDTFIQREIAALRALGLDILTCTIRATDPGHHVGAEQREAYETTFQVQTAAKRPLHLIGAHLRLFLSRPGRWLAALALAFKTAPPGARAFLWQIFYWLEAGVLAAYLNRVGARHLHSHFGDTATSVAMLAACMADLPYSYTLHGPNVFYAPRHWRLDVKTARAKFVVCISHFARSQAMLFSDPVHWDKLHVVHCGIDPARYDRASCGPAGRHVLFVGRLAPEKGLLVLLDAFAAAWQTHPDARLTLVGDGSDRLSIEARVRALGLEPYVSFTGYLGQADVAVKLAEADIFALPSFAEGLPVVLMEAMASRLPVVTTRIAGVGELVEDGVSGCLVPPGDGTGFADALRAVMADPVRSQTMGGAGRATVCAEFDSFTEARRLQALFEGEVRAGRVRPEIDVTPSRVRFADVAASP